MTDVDLNAERNQSVAIAFMQKADGELNFHRAWMSSIRSTDRPVSGSSDRPKYWTTFECLIVLKNSHSCSNFLMGAIDMRSLSSSDLM